MNQVYNKQQKIDGLNFWERSSIATWGKNYSFIDIWGRESLTLINAKYFYYYFILNFVFTGAENFLNIQEFSWKSAKIVDNLNFAI